MSLIGLKGCAGRALTKVAVAQEGNDRHMESAI